MMKSRIFPVALCAALFSCALPAAAAPANAEPKTQNPQSQGAASAGPKTGTRFLNPASISQRALPNGVRGVVQENPGADLVSVQVWVRAGSRFENKNNNGVTHLIETLALREARSTPAATSGNNIEAKKVIEALGGQLGSLTARDSMFYSATVASPFLPQALRVLSAATLFPDLSDAKVEEAKEELLTEFILRNDPMVTASDLAYQTAFSTHPYRWPANGTPAGVAALTGNKVRFYHKARFAGANISVVVSGDVNHETGHKLIAQYFGSAPKASGTPHIAQDKPLTSVLRQSRRGTLPVSVLTFAFQSPGISKAEDVIAADVLLAHWEEGREAALGKVLRAEPLSNEEEETEDGEDEEQQQPPSQGAQDEESAPLALGFEVDYLTQRDSGLFLITIVAPRDRAAVTSAILGEITRVQNEGISDSELARAKNLLRQQYIQQGETHSGQAGSMGFYEMIDSYQFALSYLDRIERVTNDDLKRVATTYLKTDAHVQALIEGVRPPVQEPESGGPITARRFD